MCPRCHAPILFSDQNGETFCLPCGWTEPSALTIEQADAELRSVRAKSGNTDNYRHLRPATHSTKYLERYG